MTTATRTHAQIAEARSEVLRAWRQPEFVLPTILFPPAFYLFFVVLMPMTRGGGEGLYFLATFGIFGATAPGLFGFGVGVAAERERGLLALKKASPMPASAYVLSKMAVSLVFAVAVVGLLHGLAAGLGGVRLPVATWAGLFLIQVFTTVPFALLGMIVGFRVSATAAAALVNMMFLGMAVLGGLWMPIFAFPDWLQSLAWALPTFHFGELALQSVGARPENLLWAHLAYCVVFTLAAFALALASFRAAFPSR